MYEIFPFPHLLANSCMIFHHLRFAWRTLLRHKGFTAIHILGLATGICACICIYSITAYELSFDTFHPDADRIYRMGSRITEHDAAFFDNEVAPPTAQALRQEVPGLETIARYYPYSTAIAPNAILTDSAYFNIFSYHWLAGNPKTALTLPYAVVLTATQARKYFGPAPPASWLGREVIYDDSLHVHVSGIVSDWTRNTDFPYTDLISLSTIQPSFLHNSLHPDSWQPPTAGNPWICTFIKLAPGNTPEELTKKLTPFVKRHFDTDPLLRLLHFSLVLQPLTDIHFNPAYSHDGIRKAHLPILYGLMATALFILLLAVVNFINLSTAQTQRRAKELDMRRILGSSRTQLMIRFLTETALITLLATIIAIFSVRPVLAAFYSWLPPDLQFHPLDIPALLFILSITALTTLLSGVYPARLLTAPTLSKSYTFRKALIVFQFSISLIFIIGSIVVGRQLHFMLNADPGFTRNAVLTVTDFEAPLDKLRLFAQKSRQIPGISNLTLQGHAPAGRTMIEIPVRLENRKEKELMVSLQAGDRQFLPFYHIPTLAGHYEPIDDSSRGIAINDTYRRDLGFPNPAAALGHFLTWNDGQQHPIVAVIADFHTSSFHDPIYPLLIGQLPNLQHSLALRLSAENPAAPAPAQPAGIPATLTRLATTWHSIFPDQPFPYSFLDESIARLYQSDIQQSWLVHAATAITIFISCMGLLGLILFVVEQRKKEIGIRKVLGAGTTDIVVLLNREFIQLIGIALLIAAPMAGYATHRWLQGFAYRTTISWWIFLLAGGSAMLIAALTIAVSVIRAALANPVDTIKKGTL